MSEEKNLQVFRALLEQEQAQLEAKLDEVGGGAFGRQPPSQYPGAAQAANWRGEAQSPHARVTEQLAEVARALSKLDNGTYGHCEACQSPIATARLEALPAARMCVSCASKAN